MPKAHEFTSPQLSSHSNSPMQISTSTLSVDVSIAATLVNIPITCLEGIWVKAKRLMETDGAIAPALGQPSEARMVLSYSGKTPHMVTPKKMETSVEIQVVPTGNRLASALILLQWLKLMDSSAFLSLKKKIP